MAQPSAARHERRATSSGAPTSTSSARASPAVAATASMISWPPAMARAATRLEPRVEAAPVEVLARGRVVGAEHGRGDPRIGQPDGPAVREQQAADAHRRVAPTYTERLRGLDGRGAVLDRDRRVGTDAARVDACRPRNSTAGSAAARRAGSARSEPLPERRLISPSSFNRSSEARAVVRLTPEAGVDHGLRRQRIPRAELARPDGLAQTLGDLVPERYGSVLELAGVPRAWADRTNVMTFPSSRG